MAENHIIHNWEVADATALAALSVTAVDIGKVALQLDEDQFYVLKTISPSVWGALVNSTPTVYTPGTDNFGYLNIPQNSQSADYTLVLTDSGKHIYHPVADTTDRIYTIPANASVAFPVGTAVTFINSSPNIITISITTDTLTFATDGTAGSRTLAQWGVATAIKITTTEWIISGVGLT